MTGYLNAVRHAPPARLGADMPDHPVATPTESAGAGDVPGAGGLRGPPPGAQRATVRAFVAVAVGLGAYAVVRQWHDVRTSLVDIGCRHVGALVAVLAGLASSVQVWRVLLASLGSPLPMRAAAKVVFVGQLGKYLPGAIWPVLAQMELGTAHQVPRARSATASMLTMIVSLLGGLIAALVTLPFMAG